MPWDPAKDLLPGDVMLYKPSSIYGTFIRLKTWHSIAHVEIYLGDSQSSASRDGKGVNIYPYRLTELVAVMRPKQPFDAAKARAYTTQFIGTPYGWLDLLNFAGFNIDKKGIVCSPWVTNVLRNNGIPVFNNDPANLIAPFEFLDSELLTQVF